MSGEPIEFRAAKPGLTVADWLASRLRHDAVICAGAAAALLAAGLAAFLGTFGVVWFVLLVARFAFCGFVPSWGAAIVAFCLLAGLFFLQQGYDGDDTEPIDVDAGARGILTLRLSRLTGNSWLMFLDGPSADLNPVSRFVLNVALLSPRLFAVSRRMWRRARQLKRLDLQAVAAGLDALMQAGGRVPIGDLLQELPRTDPQRFVADLTAFDGVILLGSEPPSLTLAPSVAEEFEGWKREIRKKRRGANY